MGMAMVFSAAASVIGSGRSRRSTFSAGRSFIRPWRAQAARICSMLVLPAAASTILPGA